MPKVFAALLLILTPLSAFAETALWQDVNPNSITVSGKRVIVPNSYRTVRLNRDALVQVLAQAPMEFTPAARGTSVILSLPKPDGTMARFRIEESPMVSARVAKERPDWKTYSGRGIDDPTAVARLSWSAEGLRAYVLGIDGAYYVDPYAAGDRKHYISYRKDDAGGAQGSFHCEIDRYLSDEGRRVAQFRALNSSAITPAFSNGANLRTYRVAIATTGEYTVDRGGQTSALTDVMNAVNRINLIYRRDLSISLTLVSGANTVFPDPNTDPYDNSDNGAQLTINQMQLDNIIGNGNYDLGHLFGTGGGGVATTPAVCSNQKAEGYSARVPPTGDPFWVDYVAHEMGHQLSAEHTYNTLEGGVCSTRSAPDAFEVASGSTVMSYVGICSSRNLQRFSADVFHARSLTQILNETNTGTGASCGATTATGNSAPVANAGANFTIPKMTPFTLTASATDANPGDALTYSWEENDLAPSASGPNGAPANTYDVDTDGVLRPLFRTYPPSTNPSRTFPSLPYILDNANTPPLTFTGTSPTGAVCETGITCVTGENLPTVARTMNFRVVVRDNQTGVNDALMQVDVRADSGPFVVTAPNTAITATGGMPLTVTWNVANTTAAPVSAANVKISVSTDGGMTFPTVLLESTPNDGSESVTLPNVSTASARIKVEAVGNIFFDISDANFTITGGGPTPTPTATPTPTPGATPGSAANISTRLPVGTGDNILITGFIITGPTGSTKRVLVRGIGPSTNVPGALADPTLELRDINGALLASNDNWRTTQIGGIITADQVAEIEATNAQPTNPAESALIATLAPGNYTAQIRGANNTTGIGLAEAYDLSLPSLARYANVSTRGFVQTGDNLMIGGFILVNNPVRVVIRGIGPSLTALGVPNALADPTLELRGGNGMLILANDNWRDTQAAEIMATTLQPTNDLESAMVMTLQPGNYTVQLRGSNNGTGNGLVEIYALPTLP